MKHSIPHLALCLALCSVSCKDNPELVEKSAAQRAEISRLELEIGLLEQKLKDTPPDVSSELKDLEELASQQTAVIGKLETELTDLRFRKKSVQEEFDRYKLTYRIK